MTTKLDAINTMLSCIKHAPLNTLEGTKSSFAISAEKLLESETIRTQLKGYDFNTEDNYPLNPDVDGIIKIPDNVLKVQIPQIYKNQYIIRASKLYDKYNHTFKINHPLYVTIIFSIPFEDLPEVVQRYITMSAAFKFTKRELGSETASGYTQQDLLEAASDLLEHELDLGNYSLIPEFYTREIKGDL